MPSANQGLNLNKFNEVAEETLNKIFKNSFPKTSSGLDNINMKIM